MTRTGMHIVHLGKYYPPEYGGIESVTEALAEDHAAAGNTVEVLCFSREASKIETDGNLTIRRHGILAEISSQPLSPGYVLHGISIARKADIVHVHMPNILAALVALAAGRKPRIVVHWHADIEGKGILGKIVRPIETLLLKRANAVVATSRTYSESSLSLRDHLSKITVIPIGIADIGQRNKQRSVKHDQILFVGRLVPYKGLPVLLRALAKMKLQARLVIVGSGPEFGALTALADELQIRDRIDFLGNVDQSTLLELFEVSTVFCLPSINRLEAFGVVLLEAMRSGCPAISSRIPGSGVSWVNKTGPQFDVFDHETLATNLDEVIGSPEKRKKYSLYARERFAAEFKREIMSKRFLDLYRTL